jgi:c-di-GMP-related signal transduction protein
MPPPSSSVLLQQHQPAKQVAIARQAILDSDRDVFGYELFDRSIEANAHTAATDARLLFNVLSGTDGETFSGSKTLFINCTLDSIAGGHLDLVSPERVVLEIPPLPVSQVSQIQDRLHSLTEIQKRGFRLAFEYSILTRPYESWLPLASFIKFDLSLLKAPAIGSFIKLAQSKTTALLIAEKVETIAQYQMVAGLGVGLFQGYWFAKPVILQGHTVRPTQANILHLINLVRQQASTSDIEEVFKRDPTLSFNLLRFINSAGFGMRTEVTSFKHAVMLLGLKRLFKWAALLMTTSQSGDTPPAVGVTAVVRGRLMELLAEELLPTEECDNAFVVGVFSLLDAMLGVSMDAALAALSLPAHVTDALLHHSGPLAPILALTIACETGDDLAFAQAATTLELSSKQINSAHLQALSWADTLGT